jgi:ABC-2 type transport system ATP-binding protein
VRATRWPREGSRTGEEWMNMNALVIENVSKSFGTVRAVDDLSVRVPAGSIYGFLGPNGAGKTTTLRMIMDIIYPDSGRIHVLGDSSGAQFKKKVGYMPEERGLYRKMKVRTILSYLGAIKGMGRHDLAREIPRWLDAVGLEEWIDKRVEDLSRGMQQKLQFVATAINDPELLILDEPFAGLDPVNLDLLKGIMLRMRDAGKTVILSTHVMDQAERLCDFILLINKGKKVIDGTLDEIRSRYDSDVVSVELEGEADFVVDLPIVRSATREGRRLEIVLDEGADSQELLQELVGRVRVNAFEVKVPSLHEIFVDLAGENNG